MAGTKNPRTAACAGRAPAGDALGKTTAAKTCRATNSTLVLPRLRLTGVARRIQHGRQLDGQARRSQFLCRRLFHAAHRTSGETALTRDARPQANTMQLRQRGSPAA